MKSIKIAAAQGFWGDYNDAPLRQLQGGKIDYLVFDYLAELTMSILSKQKLKDSNFGYAKDFPQVIKLIAADLVKYKVKVIANAGGVNPTACATAIKKILKEQGLEKKLKIAIVSGDNLIEQVSNLIVKGHPFKNLDTDESLNLNKYQLVSANAYLGSAGIVSALQADADIIITGRVADAALPLAALQYEFGWSVDDYDRLALGMIAGHIIECGAQASGGNCSYNWQSIPDLWNIGYPIIEAHQDGRLYITKHENTGGVVNLQTVKEQLIYEIGDPKNYLGPDVISDFTSVSLTEVAENKVEIKNARGKAPSDFYKVSMAYNNGYKAEGTLIYTWPEAYEKAHAAQAIVKERLQRAGYNYEDYLAEYIGYNACHGSMLESDKNSVNEILLRIAVRSNDYKAVEAFTRELVPLVLAGPPGASGYIGSRSKVQEVYSYWPCLIEKDQVEVEMQIENGDS